MAAEDLLLRQNLILWNIYLFESFAIADSILGLSNNITPLLIVGVDNILDLESDSRCVHVVVPLSEELLADLVHVVKAYCFADVLLMLGMVCWCGLLGFSFGLSAEVVHQFGAHVAEDRHVLIVHFLLEVIETGLDDVTI